MRLIKVGAAALNQTPIAWGENLDNIVRVIELAKGQGVEVLCLPELCISGYGVQDFFHSTGVLEEALASLVERIVPICEGIIVSVGLPMYWQGALYNCTCVVADREIQGFYAKQNLAGDGVHYEPRWFKSWPSGFVGEVAVAGAKYPIGDIYFEIDEIVIGIEICEDAWVAKRPGRHLAAVGADIILNPSASHFAFGKHEVRRDLVSEGSRVFGVSYLYSNLLGNEAGRIIYDGDCMIATLGKIVAEGQRFSLNPVELTTAIIDIEATRMARAKLYAFKPEAAARMVKVCDGRIKLGRDIVSGLDPRTPLAKATTKYDEFIAAITLGLFDYLRKSKLKGFVISLSGGADSSSVAMLVWLMVRRAVNELGVEGTFARLGWMRGMNAAAIANNDLLNKVLTCVFQGTKFSSKETRQSAATLASAIGAQFISWDIDALVGDVERNVGSALTIDLNSSGEDWALSRENVQARVRSPGVWMVANLSGKILLVCSNRSEAAVGYATMDGDTSGCINPIGGVSKHFLLEWLMWMEKREDLPAEVRDALCLVNSLKPSAELRAGQRDEDDLMPYDVLDKIEQLAVEKKLCPVDILRLLSEEFSEERVEKLGEWIEKFFRLWARNQWKRERFAICFHVDDYSLDPKTACRFPVLSGSFAKELEALRSEIKRLSCEK
ncbi:MAG: NAD(+) synthase [Deltaproteobacteria bacterium]|nr:NAD(+) synthase [Deltaproteobacteria bacterium]